MNPHERATMLYQHFESQLFYLPRQNIFKGRGSLVHDAMWDLITYVQNLRSLSIMMPENDWEL